MKSLENLLNGTKNNFTRIRNAAVLTGGILAGLAGNANADNNIYVDVDPTLGPASSPVIDMTDYVVQGYLMNETETERTVGLRIYKLMPDGTADPDHFEIRKVLTLGLNEDATIDDLATVPRTEGLDFSGIAGQLPEYWSGLYSNISLKSFTPDMPHTMYIDTSSISEGSLLFNGLVEIFQNFNQKLSGYESVMPNDIINIETYVGNGNAANPVYPEGFDTNNFRNSIVILDSNLPTSGNYDVDSKVLGLKNWTYSNIKQEAGRAFYPGASGTIDSAATNDTQVSALDVLGLRIPYTTDVQGQNGETTYIRLNDLFEANSDNGGAFPYGLPADQEMAPLKLDADGSATIQAPLRPIQTKSITWGSVKVMHK